MRSSHAVRDRLDTWDEGWEARLTAHVQAAGHATLWDHVRGRPGVPYGALAEALSAAGGFGVVGIQVERLQVRDTPDAELAASIRDSLARHLRAAFIGLGWRGGPYWESRALGALGSWSAMWAPRVDVSHLKRRMFELETPPGWLPADEADPVLLTLVPDVAPADLT